MPLTAAVDRSSDRDVKSYRAELARYAEERTEEEIHSLRSRIDRDRNAAAEAGDEQKANALWCIQTLLDAQSAFDRSFRLLQEDRYYDGWCELEHCELALRAILRNYSSVGFGLLQMYRSIPRFQSLFPYRWFLSPAYLVRVGRCSVCNQVFRINGGCNHRVGRVYGGLFCYRAVEDAEIQEISLVTNPVQKYSVLWSPELPYNYAVVAYAVKALGSPWKKWTVERSVRELPEPLFEGIEGEECPCGTGRAFEACCIARRQMRPHYQFGFVEPIPPDLPEFVDNPCGPRDLSRSAPSGQVSPPERTEA